MSKGLKTGIQIAETVLRTLLLLLLILFLLSLCVSCVTAKKEPTIEDTILRDEDRNWIEVYKYEMLVAIENDDEAAYHFFFWAWVDENKRLGKPIKVRILNK
tara:strand:+ start:11290 stop:11595 length:306 start_codon:yes stop_codon:yes gene_type:complete